MWIEKREGKFHHRVECEGRIFMFVRDEKWRSFVPVRAFFRLKQEVKELGVLWGSLMSFQ
jgi:hypothetical protein